MMGLLLALLFLQDAKPLPELQPFLVELRKTLRTDDALLSQYTYTQKETSIQLDSKKQPKKTEVKVFEVFPGIEGAEDYKRLVSRDGVPLSREEIEKQDKQNKKETDSRKRKLQKKTQAEIDRDRAKAEREEDEAIDDVFALYDMRMLRRETIDGHDMIVLSFKPRPRYKPKTSDGKIYKHFAGQAWISEADHQLARLDLEIIEPVSFAFGLLAKVHKGARLSAVRTRINDEIWLPSKIEVTVSGRLFLVKGISLHEIVEYSDHKKYRVETIIRVPPGS